MGLGRRARRVGVGQWDGDGADLDGLLRKVLHDQRKVEVLEAVDDALEGGDFDVVERHDEPGIGWLGAGRLGWLGARGAA